MMFGGLRLRVDDFTIHDLGHFHTVTIKGMTVSIGDGDSARTHTHWALVGIRYVSASEIEEVPGRDYHDAGVEAVVLTDIPDDKCGMEVMSRICEDLDTQAPICDLRKTIVDAERRVEESNEPVRPVH